MVDYILDKIKSSDYNLADIKVFEGNNMKDGLEKCFKEGYYPATVDILRSIKYSDTSSKSDANSKNLSECIFEKFYDTSTIKGDCRDATFDELLNIEEFYKQGGHLLGVYLGKDGVKGGHISFLNRNVCFVGIHSVALSAANVIAEKYIQRYLASKKNINRT